MIGTLLPAQMTRDEARGFRIACACFATWGKQLAGDPTLEGSVEAGAARNSFRQYGRVVVAMAKALDRQLGQATAHDIPLQALAETAAPH